MSFTGRKSFSRKSIDKPQPTSISTSRSVPAMPQPQPLSPTSRFGFSNSASARGLSSHPLDSPAAGPVGRKKSLSPSTASTAHSGDSYGSSGKGGSSLSSIRSLGARFGFGKSPSSGKKSLPFGGATVNSHDADLAAQQPPQAPSTPAPPGQKSRSPLRAGLGSFSRPPLEPASMPISPRLAPSAMSEVQSTRHSVDAVPARSRTSSLADSHSRSSLNLPTRRDSSPGGSGSLLRAPLGSLSRSNSWIAPSLGRVSRERIEEEGESQVMNISEIGEVAGGGGAGGNGGLVIDLTNSLTIRGPPRPQSRSRSNSTIDKPLPTPPLQEPMTLKPAIKLTPDGKTSSLPGSTPMGTSMSHLAVSPSTSSFSLTPIMNGSPLLPKGVLGELARELKNVAESPSTRQLLRARASAVELSRPVSSVNPDGQGVNAQLGLMELKGAVERMRAMVEELERGVTSPVAFEILAGEKKPEGKLKEKETAVLDRSDSDLVAILTPKLGHAETPKVPDPEPISKQSLSTPSTPPRVHFLANAPTISSTVVEGPPTITKKSATSKVEMHDEHDDGPYEDFQPGAESSPALSRPNTFKYSTGSGIRTSTNTRRTGRTSIDFPHDEEDVHGGKALGRRPLTRGSASPGPSSYDDRQSPSRPGSAASRLLGRNTISSTSNARDRPPMPAWEGMRKNLSSGTGTGADRRGSGANSPSPGSAPALGGSQFYHRRASSTLARPTTTENARSPLNHSRNLRSVGSFDESREWGSSKGAGRGIVNPTSVPGQRLSDISTGLGPRTARAFAAAGILPGNYKSPASEKDFRTLEKERATSSMSARRDPAGSGSDRLGTWSRLGFNRARSDVAHGHRSPPSGAMTGVAFSDSTTASSPTSSGAPRAAVASFSTVSSSNSGPSTTNVPASNHQAIITTLKERHELETEALLNALSQTKKESKALREMNEELKGEVEGLTKFLEGLEERLADEVAKRKTVERQLEEQKRYKERRAGDIPPIPRSESPLWRRKEREERPGSLLREGLPKKSRHTPPPERSRGGPRVSISSDEDEPTQNYTPAFCTTAPTPERNEKQQRHRSGSFASSIALPVMSDSMTLLMEETPGMAGIRVNHSSFDNRSFRSMDSPPPSPTLAVGKSIASTDSFTRTITRRDPTSSTSPTFQTAARPIPKKQGGLRASAFDQSPTSSMEYSVMPASPGSLVLRDEDDHHLADLTSVIHDDSHYGSN